MTPAILDIPGGYRLTLGPHFPIGDFRTHKAAEEILLMLGRFNELPSMTAAELAMCAGYSSAMCIGEKHRRLRDVWGVTLATMFYSLSQSQPQSPEWFEGVDLSPLWIYGWIIL
jgi:hypothetical protein